ncbi:hypothetical protein DFH09DRAFT_1336375 [Mycena vulgaris]|nr:hypothetical protein DFH09DRAFT_1337034 [Mycena vulgaris]KAJ6499826.1 hypothetical protein DFH09DRAFT_1336375 [Mycena vulgaris]
MRLTLAVIFSALTIRSSATCGDPTLVVPFYRSYESAGVDHLYSTDVANINTNIVNGITVFQGVAGLVFVTQEVLTVQFYRLFSGTARDHFYTTSTTERDAALQNGYVLQAETIYIYPAQICGSIPLFHLFSAAGKDNFYTTSEVERLKFITTLGYADVGIAGYIFPVVPPCA